MKNKGMIKQISKQAFWDLFDYLGRLIVINLFGIFLLYLCTMLISFGGMILPLIVFLIIAPLIANYWIAGYSHFLGGITKDKDPSLRDFFRAGKTKFKFSILPMITIFLTLYLLMINVRFYTALSVEMEKFHLIFFTILGFFFWASLMIIMSMLHLCIYRGRLSEKAHWKYGFYFLIKYPVITIFFTVFLILFIVLVFLSKFAVFVIFGLTLPLLILHSIQDVIFDLEQERAEEVESDEKRVTSWKEIVKEEGAQETERLIKSRYDRTFRDIMKPWGDQN